MKAQLQASAMLIMLSVLSIGQDSNWSITQGKSEMTDEPFTRITTLANDSSKTLGGALGITCSAGNVDVAVFTEGTEYQPAQTGEIKGLGHWYGHPSTEVRLRFDSAKPTGHLEWVLPEPSAMLAWQGIGMSGKGLVKKLIVANRFLVEYTTVVGKTRVLRFDVSGLREAVQRAPECKIN